MKIMIDVDELEREGVLTPELAAKMRQIAMRDTGSTAINIVLAFGAIAVAAGLLALFQSVRLGALLGFGFSVGGFLVERALTQQWSKLGRIWMTVGALLLAGSSGLWIDRPMIGPLVAAAILFAVAIPAQSHLLIALTPFALAAAIGGSTGYWGACYEIAVREPTLTILLFTALGVGAWQVALRGPPALAALSVTFARISVVLVNFGFWVGSLWGDTPGDLWRNPSDVWSETRQIPALAFVIAWAVALVIAGAWGARNGRRFLVNAAATFGGIHFYTQWFERLGADPMSVIGAGLAAIAIGFAIWKYNARLQA